MLICSGTMPTFEPLTTKQTNLALCSTIQTGFIDRRIAATRSSSGSSGAGINAAGVAPGATGHPPRAGPARGCCRPRALVPGHSAEGGAGHGACKALLAPRALLRLLGAAFGLVMQSQDPRFGCCSAVVVPSSSSRTIQGPFQVTEG